MVSKTAKIIAFFIILGIITPLGVLAQENPWMITVFNNVSDIPEEPNPDIEFNGITIIFFERAVFMPENRTEPLDFKDDFTVENVNQNQTYFKDELKAGRRDALEDYFLDENITFKEYPDDTDNRIFFGSFLKRHPFMRFELNPVEVENWTVNNITLTGKIRVHATIFKNGFCVISLVFPIVTEELKDEYNLKGDFLLADKPLKPDDVIYITNFRSEGKISLKEGNMTTFTNICRSGKRYVKHAFFEDEKIKDCSSSHVYCIYSWNTNKTLGKGNSTELLKENPWEIYGILATEPVGGRILKPYIFSTFSEVFTTYYSFHIFGSIGYFAHENITDRTIIDEYAYWPSRIRLAEVVFLQEYMLGSYNVFVTEKLEELGRIEESEYPKEVKEIAQFRKEISIALDEFYLIEDSLRYTNHRDFVRYGKQKRNLDFMHDILRVKMEDLSKVSGDMNNVIMQENNAALQKNNAALQASMMDIENKMVLLTLLGIILAALAIIFAVFTFFGNMYSEEIKTKLRRLWERKAKK